MKGGQHSLTVPRRAFAIIMGKIYSIHLSVNWGQLQEKRNFGRKRNHMYWIMVAELIFEREIAASSSAAICVQIGTDARYPMRKGLLHYSLLMIVVPGVVHAWRGARQFHKIQILMDVSILEIFIYAVRL